MQNKYRILFGFIICILLFNQIYIQNALSKKKDDAQIINLAGRQRMLSQRIALLYQSKPTQTDISKELNKTIEEWKNNHFALLNGSQSIDLESIESNQIKQQLSQLEPQINFITRLSQTDPLSLDPAQKVAIFDNQNSFLIKMNEVVKQLELEAEGKLKRIIIIEAVLFLIALIIVLVELFFVFLPLHNSLRRQNKDLQENNEELKRISELNIYLSKYASIITHDLRAPMLTIASFSEMLEEEELQAELSEETQQAIGFIKKATHNMEQLIQDLTQISRMDNETFAVETFDLQAMLTLLVRELAVKIEEKKATIQFENIPSQFIGHPSKIRLIFQNLISNALKYSRPDVPPVLTIRGTENAQNWAFSIQDNGMGIAQKNLPKIFDIFYKEDRTNKNTGSSGIGLAMVKKVVDQHQGTIKVTSQKGQGTTFNFTIPKDFVSQAELLTSVP